jgi:hypothetical protein
MGVGVGGPQLPPIDVDRLTDDLPSPSRRTRILLSVALGVMTLFVAASLVWMFLPE